MTACGRLCCKTIFTTKLSNIDSRTGRGAQDRFKTSLLGRTDVAMRASPAHRSSRKSASVPHETQRPETHGSYPLKIR
jgi:hypothetical protein